MKSRIEFAITPGHVPPNFEGCDTVTLELLSGAWPSYAGTYQDSSSFSAFLRAWDALQIHREHSPVVQQKQEIGNCCTNSDEGYSSLLASWSKGITRSLSAGGKQLDV